MKILLIFRIALLLPTLILLVTSQVYAQGQDAEPAPLSRHSDADTEDGRAVTPQLQTAFDQGQDSARVTWGTFAGRGDAVWTSPANLLGSALPDDVLMNSLDALKPQQLHLLDRESASMADALVDQYARATDDARRNEIRSQLAFIVGQHFMIRQTIRDRDIAELEKEVASLRERLQQREDAKQQITEGRVDQLLRSARGLGWDGEPAELPSPKPNGIVSPGITRPIGVVSGTVTFKGQPYMDAAVVFSSPEHGRYGPADIQKDGSYRLPTPLPTDTYKIHLVPRSTPASPTSVPIDPRVPHKYWDDSTTDIYVTVNTGRNSIDVELAPSVSSLRR